MGNGPYGIAVNPAGTYVYVVNDSSNNVSVIATTTNRVVAAIPVGRGPYGVTVNPAGTYVYIANNESNNVSVVATGTNKVVATIPVGASPAAFGLFIGGPDTHSITASAVSGGSISPAGTSSVKDGGNLSYTIKPSAGHAIADVLIDGVSVGEVGSYTFTNTTANHTISAVFSVKATYSITASKVSGGSISPAGTSSVKDGGNLSYTIKPSAGHAIADVVIDGVSVGAVDSHTFTKVTANHTISAVFSVKAPYSISGTIKASGGAAMPGVMITLSGSKTVTTTTDSKGSYSFTGLPNGTYTVTYTVTPGLSGYSFTPSNMRVDGTNLTGQDLTETTGNMSSSMLGKVTTACVKMTRNIYGEAIFTNNCSYEVYVIYCYIGGDGGWTLRPGGSVNTYTTNFISYAACEDKMGGMWDPVTNEALGSECDTGTGQYNAASFVCSVFQ